ncbi:hypothetical protein FNF29_02881 [Cafeteria roenbergensis]|uniref:Uncharacterized protein n=1 Tax=Cafeteria roenbergensis TaxID=33653 RepID=A0A5A8CL99_CAFRO|nr:hypothetical protein FNF29_02881 [Cafeteria roenbergensis]|eukprot:KAA0153893.1 hypothetical protein FNF29_02881 [Cafeteria roenbergensis]
MSPKGERVTVSADPASAFYNPASCGSPFLVREYVRTRARRGPGPAWLNKTGLAVTKRMVAELVTRHRRDGHPTTGHAFRISGATWLYTSRKAAAHPRPGATWPRTRCFEPVPASQARLAGSMRTIAVALVVLALWAPAFAVDCTIGALYVWSARLIRCPMADATMRIPLLKAGKVELPTQKTCGLDMATDPLQYFEAALGRALDHAKDTELSTGCEMADLVVHGVVPINDIAKSDFEKKFLDLVSSVRVPEAEAQLPSFSLLTAAETAFEGLEYIRQTASGQKGIQAGLVQVYNYPVSLREYILPSMALLCPESVAWTSLNSSLDGLEGAAPELGEHAQLTS